MTQTSNRILDEFARLMTDAAGVARGVKEETETILKSQAEKVLRELDVVQREEFEAVREMAAKAREENDRLAARIAELETRLAGGAAKTAQKRSTRGPVKTGTAAGVKPSGARRSTTKGKSGN